MFRSIATFRTASLAPLCSINIHTRAAPRSSLVHPFVHACMHARRARVLARLPPPPAPPSVRARRTIASPRHPSRTPTLVEPSCALGLAWVWGWWPGSDATRRRRTDGAHAPQLAPQDAPVPPPPSLPPQLSRARARSILGAMPSIAAFPAHHAPLDPSASQRSSVRPVPLFPVDRPLPFSFSPAFPFRFIFVLPVSCPCPPLRACMHACTYRARASSPGSLLQLPHPSAPARRTITSPRRPSRTPTLVEPSCALGLAWGWTRRSPPRAADDGNRDRMWDLVDHRALRVDRCFSRRTTERDNCETTRQHRPVRVRVRVRVRDGDGDGDHQASSWISSGRTSRASRDLEGQASQARFGALCRGKVLAYTVQYSNGARLGFINGDLGAGSGIGISRICGKVSGRLSGGLALAPALAPVCAGTGTGTGTDIALALILHRTAPHRTAPHCTALHRGGLTEAPTTLKYSGTIDQQRVIRRGRHYTYGIRTARAGPRGSHSFATPRRMPAPSAHADERGEVHGLASLARAEPGRAQAPLGLGLGHGVLVYRCIDGARTILSRRDSEMQACRAPSVQLRPPVVVGTEVACTSGFDLYPTAAGPVVSRLVDRHRPARTDGQTGTDTDRPPWNSNLGRQTDDRNLGGAGAEVSEPRIQGRAPRALSRSGVGHLDSDRSQGCLCQHTASMCGHGMEGYGAMERTVRLRGRCRILGGLRRRAAPRASGKPAFSCANTKSSVSSPGRRVRVQLIPVAPLMHLAVRLSVEVESRPYLGASQVCDQTVALCQKYILIRPASRAGSYLDATRRGTVQQGY
ncbi:hypothetical protein HETIRDRAFT_455571 [Heterobasidion irregulare TC 32-1]|uniref:Uncharacterized protein n=1 Tax=Heterobasidion irregulare (strain TC 32-1) TaxID=747525 RepID=W4JQU8_HETIT|nr:uncharacterized protein HETIRDRAFT_455571 [Heterobasidion irregulare TC 32-1]ETW75937.1 hypothetical protein HETIRDRAFT_455571 [Heterobasidion irregulare TC 32-1]